LTHHLEFQAGTLVLTRPHAHTLARKAVMMLFAFASGGILYHSFDKGSKLRDLYHRPIQHYQ